jgi:hypothetical protein
MGGIRILSGAGGKELDDAAGGGGWDVVGGGGWDVVGGGGWDVVGGGGWDVVGGGGWDVVGGGGWDVVREIMLVVNRLMGVLDWGGGGRFINTTAFLVVEAVALSIFDVELVSVLKLKVETAGRDIFAGGRTELWMLAVGFCLGGAHVVRYCSLGYRVFTSSRRPRIVDLSLITLGVKHSEPHFVHVCLTSVFTTLASTSCLHIQWHRMT